MSYASYYTSIKSFIRDVVPRSYLPAIQRELVWDTEKIEDLFDSITRGFPFGILLMWNVKKPAIHNYSFYQLIREYDGQNPHNIKANLDDQNECFGILDGQQRTTALFLGLKGHYRMKIPRLWKENPNAWVIKTLYLNLLHLPIADDRRKYEFEFLSEAESKKNDDQHYWYRVGEILKYDNEQDLRDWRRGTPFRDSDVFEDNLQTLWNALNKQTGITYFLEDNQDLNQVLTIFVRLNMGGEPLSYSDMLLSLATATWTNHDAREEIYGLVKILNSECGEQFNFNKDVVLKTLLVMNDKDVRFRTENIQKDAGLEQKWDEAKKAMPLAAKLLASFGFSERTLTANNSIIPIAYYLARTGRDETFLKYNDFKEDKNRIRIWLCKILLGRVFGRQSDDLLRRIRESLKPLGIGQAFPDEDIIQKIGLGRNLAFSVETIDEMIEEVDYWDPRAFLILSLITPIKLDPGIQYNVDHIHPRSGFIPAEMQKAGMPDEDIKWTVQRQNSLFNLELLPDQVNKSKLDKSYAEWLSVQEQSSLYREIGLIPNDISLEFSEYKPFIESRRKILRRKLMEILNVKEEIK